MRLASQHRGLLAVVWFAFLVRGAFYCVEQPMWEGYDEWAHFAYVQHLATHGSRPERTDLVSAQVWQSLLLVPLSKSASEIGPATTTHDAYWRLPVEERKRRENALKRLPNETVADEQHVGAGHYEAQQPPLYYAMIAPAYLAVNKLSLPAQVLTLRLINVLLVSLIVFLIYAIALRTTGNPALALMSAILLACCPGFYISICRVGNESLSIVAMSAVILCALWAWREEASARDWLLLGALTGIALLTKAYALVLLPLIAVVALLRVLRDRSTWKSTLAGWAVSSIAAVAVAGWWYLRAWRTTGALSGEQLDAATSAVSFSGKLSAALNIDWVKVADTGAFTHIWVGGWSFLLVRKWMYVVCEAVALVAVIGLVIYVTRAVRAMKCHDAARELGQATILAIACALMAGAIAYHSLAAFLAQGVTTALGWYFYAVAGPEVTLIVLGLSCVAGRRWRTVMAFVCVLAIALDLYTMHFLLMPYYSGLIVHRASGGLESFQIGELTSRFGEMMQRLTVNDPSGLTPEVLVVVWAGYLIATFALGVIAVMAARRYCPSS